MYPYEISTADLIENYFSTMPETTRKRRQAQVDRPELYDYERESKICLLDMEVENIVEMILTFGTGLNENWRKSHISRSTRKTIVSEIRGIYDFYNEHYSPKIVNPLRVKRSSDVLKERLYSYDEKFTDETLKTMVSFVRINYDEEMANYIQCIIELFISGFSDAREIAYMKEKDINFETREVCVDGRIVRLSENTMRLLKIVHKYNGVAIDLGRSIMIDWRGSYFVFPVRKTMVDDFDERDIAKVANFIYDKLTKMVVKKIESIDQEIGYRTLFLFGFYKHLVNLFGPEEVKNLVYSIKDRQYTIRYCSVAEKYGIKVQQNISVLKQMLTQFV